MATITANQVYVDPTQWWTLDYTFAESKFTWSVTAHASFTNYWNSIYGLTVNVGGNSYYRGDIDWRNYTPNTVVYSGTTNLSDCTVSNGVVTLSVTGNFYYGTWSADGRSSGSGTCAVDPPTVATLTYSATNKYSNMVVSGRSVITFTMKGTSRTGSNSITYSLYQDNSVISTTTGTSGSNKTVNVTAPSAGSHSYKYTATDGNGTSTTSGNISITTYAYTTPSFNSAVATRWTTNTSSGSASDTGKYAKCTATWNVGKIGSTNLTTTLKVSTSSPSHSATTTTSGASLWLGSNDYLADNSYTVTFLLYDNYTGEANGLTRTDTLTQGGRGIDLIYGNGHYGVAIGQKATANQFDVNMLENVANRINVGNESSTAENVVNIASGSGRVYLYSSTTAKGIWIPAHGTGSSFNTVAIDTNNYTNTYSDTYRLKSRTRTEPVISASSGSANVDAEMVNLRNGSSTITLRHDLQQQTNKVTRSSGLSISSQTFSQWGRVAQLTLVLNAGSTAYSAGSNIFVGSIPNSAPYRPITDVMGVGFYLGSSYVGWLKSTGAIEIRATGQLNFSGGTATISWTYIW